MYEHREENLVEAEALGRVGQDVGVNRVRGVRGPVGDRTFLGGQGLHDAAQPREHGQSAVLQFLDLQLFQVTRFGQGQRVESATRETSPTESSSKTGQPCQFCTLSHRQPRWFR